MRNLFCQCYLILCYVVNHPLASQLFDKVDDVFGLFGTM